MERLMTRKQAAEYLGFATQTLARYAWLRKGPRATKLGKSVRYKLEDLEAWIAEQGRERPVEHRKPERFPICSGVVIDGERYYRAKDVLEAARQIGMDIPIMSFRDDRLLATAEG